MLKFKTTDKKLELLLRAICAYEVNGEANFSMKCLDFFGSENTIRRNIEKLENLLTEDGKPILIKTNMNGMYSRYKLNKILICPEFVYKDFPVQYKIILLSLYDKELPEILTVSNVSKLTGLNYNTVKKYFKDSLKDDLLNNSSEIKKSLDGALENTSFGLMYVGARKEIFKCKCCGTTDIHRFYAYNHSTCIKCLNAKRAENLKTDIARKLYNNSQHSYNTRKNIAGYNLTVEYIQELLDNQNYKCYYTNVDLKIGSKLTNPTLDRIDSNKGYIKGNVVICTEIANIMKNDLTIDEFKEQIKLLYNNMNNF